LPRSSSSRSSARGSTCGLWRQLGSCPYCGIRWDGRFGSHERSNLWSAAKRKRQVAESPGWLSDSSRILGLRAARTFFDSGFVVLHRRGARRWRAEWRASSSTSRYQQAAGLGPLGTHAFRHTYRSWLDSVGTPLAVQQKAMRHSDIRTTMNVYGDVVDDRIGQALGKISEIAFANSTQTARSDS
jgi:integrase